jgi:hypothetical protein
MLSLLLLLFVIVLNAWNSGAGNYIEVQVSGGSIPPDATGALLNVVVVGPAGPGELQILLLLLLLFCDLLLLF